MVGTNAPNYQPNPGHDPVKGKGRERRLFRNYYPKAANRQLAIPGYVRWQRYVSLPRMPRIVSGLPS